MIGERNEQRRLAAIMFTDMVGFSALAQRDEAMALELLEEHRTLLRRLFVKHQGLEVKTIGDGFLVEFTSAVSAVVCAVEIQLAVVLRNQEAAEDRVFQLRIGIHLGDVLPRGNDIVGDGVNIAARVEPLAEPGGVAITQQVFDQVHNKIPQRLVRAGRVALKNIEQPMAVYRIALGERSGSLAQSKPPAFNPASPARHGQEKSIAVLPFVNMSSERENEFLSDGISEDLLSALSGLPGLHVAARTSCFAFKGRSDDIRRIGDALGVETVLEGSVRRSENKLRIAAQLINVADGFCLWSESFNREMRDVFAIQDDITRAIVAALKLRMAGGVDQPVYKLPTSNAEAYELCLKGRFHWSLRGTGLKKALHYFELALIEDPDYALALSGLADTYSLLSWYGYLAPAVVIPKVMTAAKRALQLDPGLAEAHTSLGFCLLCQRWDRVGAEREFRRAIKLNPRTIPAHYWLGWSLSCAGRHPEAINQCRRAVDLEPFSPIARTFLAWMHYHAGEYEEAEQQLRKVMDLDGRFVFGHWFLGKVYLAAGKREEALAALTAADEISGGNGWTRCLLGYAWAVSGEMGKARQSIADLRNVERYAYVRAMGVAMPYLGIGDRETALDWLEQGCKDRDVWALMMNVDPIYSGLRTNQRFKTLLRGIGLGE